MTNKSSALAHPLPRNLISLTCGVAEVCKVPRVGVPNTHPTLKVTAAGVRLSCLKIWRHWLIEAKPNSDTYLPSLSIRAVQQRNELLVLVVREFSSWKISTLKYQITVFTYLMFFFPNCVPIATQSICFLLSSELFSTMLYWWGKQFAFRNNCFAIYYFFTRELSSSCLCLTPVLSELEQGRVLGLDKLSLIAFLSWVMARVLFCWWTDQEKPNEEESFP